MQFSSTSATFADLVKSIVGLINLTMPVLGGMAVVLFFWGCIRYIYKAGDAKGRAAGRESIIWGLVGIFVIFSLWGIINFLRIAFFPAATPAQQPFAVLENIVQEA